jgi:hypothetical protein
VAVVVGNGFNLETEVESERYNLIDVVSPFSGCHGLNTADCLLPLRRTSLDTPKLNVE